MLRELGIRELKNTASAVIGEVEAGATVVVTRHGRPVARVVPAAHPAAIVGLLEDGVAQWSGQRPRLPEPIRLSGTGATAAEIVIADRGPR